MSYHHQPVLLTEAVDALNISKDGRYMDATFGRGGHSQAILNALGPAGQLVVLDRDATAIERANDMARKDARLVVHQSAYSALAEYANKNSIDGVLMDIGVSSPQIDDASRGFSFRHDGPLDMRMDTSTGPTASQWLQTISEKDLVKVLFDYGEERFARRIAAAIVAYQKEAVFIKTSQLAEVVREAIPRWEKDKDPATRSFQAIRIAVNDELNQLKSGLESAFQVLRQGGRLVVISFHSLEDRIVKRFMRDHARPVQPDKRLPVDPVPADARLVGRPGRPSAEEVGNNIRARSSILRVLEKL